MHTSVLILLAAVIINEATVNGITERENTLKDTSDGFGRKVSIIDAGFIGSVHSISENQTRGSVVLINNLWAITASNNVRYSRRDYELRFGSENSANGGVIRTIKEVIHVIPYATMNDAISLIKLNEKVDFSNNMWSIEIASNQELPVNGNNVSVYGFGVDPGSNRGYLRKDVVPFIDASNCRSQFHTELLHSDKNICTNKLGSPPCEHLGCPLVYNGRLIGVYSGKLGACNYSNLPAIYVDVTKYSQWIADTQMEYS